MRYVRGLGPRICVHPVPQGNVAKAGVLVIQLDGNGQVVLLDIKLKESDGLDVLREIKAEYPNLPVILVTGFKEEVAESIETALKLSAYTYFYKPLQIEELLKALNKIHHQELGRVLGRPAIKKM